MAAPAIPLIAKILSGLAGGAFGLDLLLGATTERGLADRLSGADPKGALRELDLLQLREQNRAKADIELDAISQRFGQDFLSDPNEIATLASLVQSGLFDERLVPNDEDSLARFVARELDTTPEDLARKTRPPRTPIQLLRGEF